jgi:hypothetical protein
MSICNIPIGLAKNGADRGVCDHLSGHSGKHHSLTCPNCGVHLTPQNTCPYNISRKTGKCRDCSTKNSRLLRSKREGKPVEAFRPQLFGNLYHFRCGCVHMLPTQRVSTKFVLWNGTGNFRCRVDSILQHSQWAAKKWNYAPMPLDTPHAVILKLMGVSRCERCGESLSWDDLGRKNTPHLHHDHLTGEIYGFTHNRCNLQAMENEINRLKTELRKFQ